MTRFKRSDNRLLPINLREGLLYALLPMLIAVASGIRSLPGVIAGVLLVFIPMCGEFVIPDLLGGPGTLMIGHVLWDEFFTNRDWPVAAAVAVAMLAFLILPIGLLRRFIAHTPRATLVECEPAGT